MTGVRYYHRLIEEFRTVGELARRSRISGHEFTGMVGAAIGTALASDNSGMRDNETVENWINFVVGTLDHPSVKRLLFDARQAMVFDTIYDRPQAELRQHLNLPFESMYVELTQPINTTVVDPLHARDVMNAFFLREVTSARFGQLRDVGFPDLPESSVLVHVGVFLDGFDAKDERISTVDRWLFLELRSGAIVTRAHNLMGRAGFGVNKLGPEQVMPADGTVEVFSDPDPSEMPEGITPETWIVVGGMHNDGIAAPHICPTHDDDRHVGWYERILLHYSSFVLWTLTYMIAKNVRIVAEPVSRQTRRWHERKNVPLPEPWYVVEPSARVGSVPPGGIHSERHHSYRYDVIGHLRLGRHHTKTGVKEGIEWVTAHQRGEGPYIPKTYKFSQRKRVPREVAERLTGRKNES